MMKAKRQKIVIAVASIFMIGQVNAQQADNNPAPVKPNADVSGQIQTVVVTAQKRKEDASKVPISISVIGGEELTAQHIGDYADITRAIPNVSFSGGGGGGDAGNGPGLSNIEIRGISSTAGSATVGIYMDDVSMTVANVYSMGSAEPKFFDLDRVEVLRGPQGTLYGASSMGGTIKFITNQPDLKLQTTDLYTEVSSYKGGNNNYVGNVVFNEPLIPGELALRFGVQGEHKGGYIDQVDQTGAVINSGINWQNDQVVRMALKWAPNQNFSITPSVFYQKVNTGDIDVSYTQVLSDGAPTGVVLPPYRTSKIQREPGTDLLVVPTVTVNADLGFADLTSASSYFKRQFTRTQDGTQTNSVQMANIYIVGAPTLSADVIGLPSSVSLDNKVTQFSQEVRLASKPYEVGGSPVTWLAGAYVANENTAILEDDYIHGINAAFAANGISPTDPTYVPGTLPVGFPNDDMYNGQFRQRDTQQSIFGEMNYYFAPTLHATVGMRYLHATSDFESVQNLFFNGGVTNNNPSTSGSKTTPKFAVSWEVTPTDTLFATAAEGFRVGGTNIIIPQGICQIANPNPLSYKADSLWSYELGDKSRFLHNTLAVNASLFYVKWKDMQQQIELPCSFAYDTNVGSATSYGGEIEVKVKPVSSLLIAFSGGVTHASLDNNDGVNAGVVGAVQGAAIPGVPTYNMALNATYNFNVSDEYAGFVRAGAHWTGESHGGFAVLPFQGATMPNPDFNRPAYHTFDASVGMSWNAWEMTLFVKNLLNNDMVIQRPIVQTTLGEVYRVEPRVIGVSLSAKF